jgi:hypothetical protein
MDRWISVQSIDLTIPGKLSCQNKGKKQKEDLVPMNFGTSSATQGFTFYAWVSLTAGKKYSLHANHLSKLKVSAFHYLTKNTECKQNASAYSKRNILAEL